MHNDILAGQSIQRLDNLFNAYDPTRFAEYARESLFTDPQSYEKGEMWLLILNSWREVTHEVLVTRDSSQVPLDAVSALFREAFRLRANRIVLVHTHPSSDPEPSSYDVCVTDRIRRTGEVLRLPLVDHLIVAKDAWYSMRDHDWCEDDT